VGATGIRPHLGGVPAFTPDDMAPSSRLIRCRRTSAVGIRRPSSPARSSLAETSARCWAPPPAVQTPCRWATCCSKGASSSWGRVPPAHHPASPTPSCSLTPRPATC
jgi:hypothetical protein